MKLPDVSVSRMRRDFNLIFNMHSKVDCKLIRFEDSGSGDFFDIDGTKNYYNEKIQISIQGTPDSIERMVKGIEIPKGQLSCFVKHDANLKATDLIIVNNMNFKINNLKDSYKNGECIFQEFNLEFSSYDIYE